MSEIPELISQALGSDRAGHEQFIDVLYLGILGRHADSSGMRNYSQMMAKDPNRDTLVAIVRALFTSPEAHDYREHLGK